MKKSVKVILCLFGMVQLCVVHIRVICDPITLYVITITLPYTGIFVAIANNTLYGSKLSLDIK